MEVNIEIEAVHEGEPATAKINVKFDKGEYLSVIKEAPYIISKIKLLMAQNKMKKGK